MEVCNLDMSYMISMASVLVFGMQCTFLKQSCNLCVQAAQLLMELHCQTNMDY